MIASSPTTAICNECINLFSTLLGAGADLPSVGDYEILFSRDKTPTNFIRRFFRKERTPNITRCIFCNKRQDNVDRMIGKFQQYVCNECVPALVDLLIKENVKEH
jgi:ATP-dependent protease Clp ATPase subunit